MSIIKAIDKSFKTMESRGWDYTYWFFDIHETILYPDWGDENLSKKLRFYPNAKKVLQYLTNRSDIRMGVFTCSYPDEIRKYLKFFKMNKIHFDYINNKNDEVSDTAYGFYRDKPYYNVLFEDKAGFDAEEDWEKVLSYFKL